MNDCPNAAMRDRLPDFVHGTLDAAMEARVSSHLSECADCRAEVELLRTAHRMLRASAPVVDVARIVAAIPHPTSRRTARLVPARFSTQHLRIAAAIAVMASGAATVWMSRGREADGPQRSTSSVVAAESARTGTPGLTSLPTSASVASGLSLAGGFDDLSDDDLNVLLQELDRYDIFPEPVSETSSLDVEGAL